MAEGIESAAQMENLQALGCRFGQGPIDLACRKTNSLGTAAEPWTLSARAQHVASLDALMERGLKGIANMTAHPVTFEWKSLTLR